MDFSRKARRQSSFYSLASILDLGLMADINLAVNQADGRDAHTPYTQAQSLDERLVQKNISSALAKARRLLYYKLTKNHKIKILAEVDNGFYW